MAASRLDPAPSLSPTWVRHLLQASLSLHSPADPVYAAEDRDGTLDMVYPVCGSINAKTGLGQDCAIHVSYNMQMPLCSPKAKAGDRCRPAANLCEADADFAFDLSKKSAVSGTCRRRRTTRRLRLCPTALGRRQRSYP